MRTVTDGPAAAGGSASGAAGSQQLQEGTMEQKRVTAEMLEEGWVVTTAENAVGLIYHLGAGDGKGEDLHEELQEHGVGDDEVIAFFHDDVLKWFLVDWQDRAIEEPAA